MPLDLSFQEFSRVAKSLSSKGYVPTAINPTEVNGEVRYSAIWLLEPTIHWSEAQDLSALELREEIDKFSANGFTPVHLKGYLVNGETRFSIIGRKDSRGEWRAIWGQDFVTFNSESKSLAKDGWVPNNISVHISNGKERFSTIWKYRPGVTWEMRSSLSLQEYKEIFNQLGTKGYVPIDIASYKINGEQRLAAIWEAKSGTAWETAHQLSLKEFSDLTRDKDLEGYAPYILAPSSDGNEITYDVAWRKFSSPNFIADETPKQFNSTIPDHNKSQVLDIQPTSQQTEVWCWLAVGEMIFSHFKIPNVNPAGNFQCGIIGQISDRRSSCYTNCFSCIRPAGSNIGTLNMLSNYSSLTSNKKFSYSEDRVIPPQVIMNNIDSGKPIIAGTSYTRRIRNEDSEHVVLIIGYKVKDGKFMVVVNDPFPYSSGDNPFLHYGGIRLKANQYLINYLTFRDQIFWNWSVFNLSIM